MPIRIPSPLGAGSPGPPPINEGPELAEQAAAEEGVARGLMHLSGSLARIQQRIDFRKRQKTERAEDFARELERQDREREEEAERLAARVRQTDSAVLQVRMGQLSAGVDALTRSLSDGERDDFPALDDGKARLRDMIGQSGLSILAGIEDPDMRARTEEVLEAMRDDEFPEFETAWTEGKKRFDERRREAAIQAVINQMAPVSEGPPVITGLGGAIEPAGLDNEVASVLAASQGSPDGGGSALAEWAMNRFGQYAGDEGRTLEFSLYVAQNAGKWIDASTHAEGDALIARVQERAAMEFRSSLSRMLEAADADRSGVDLDNIDVVELFSEPDRGIAEWAARKEQLVKAARTGASLGLISEGEASAAEQEFRLEQGKILRAASTVKAVTDLVLSGNGQVTLTPEIEAQVDLAWPVFQDQLDALPPEGRVDLISKILYSFKGNSPRGLTQYLRNLNVGNAEDLRVLGESMIPYLSQSRMDPMTFPADQRGFQMPVPALEDDQLAAASFMGELLMAGVPPSQAAAMVIAGQERARTMSGDPQFQEMWKARRGDPKQDPFSFPNVSVAVKNATGNELADGNLSHMKYAAAVQRYAEAQIQLGRTVNVNEAIAAGRAFADKLYFRRENGDYEYLSPMRDNPQMVTEDVIYELTQRKAEFGGQVPTMNEVRFIPLLEPGEDPNRRAYMISVVRPGQPPKLLMDGENPRIYRPDPETSRSAELMRVADAASGGIVDEERALSIIKDPKKAREAAVAALLLDVVGTRTIQPGMRGTSLEAQRSQRESMRQSAIEFGPIQTEAQADAMFRHDPALREAYRRGFNIDPALVPPHLRAGDYGMSPLDPPGAPQGFQGASELAFRRRSAREAVLKELTGTDKWWDPEQWALGTEKRIARLRDLRAYDKIRDTLTLGGVLPADPLDEAALLTARVMGAIEGKGGEKPTDEDAKVAAMNLIRSLLTPPPKEKE